MGIANITLIATEDQTITKAVLNDLVQNLATEFNGNIQDANIKALAAIAYSKLNLTGSVVIADLAATGTANSSTYLRGDGTWNTPTGGGISSTTAAFDDSDLDGSNVYTFNHAFSAQFVDIIVFDNNNIVIFPDNITATDINNTAIDLSSYGTITGTWNVRGIA